MIAPARVAAATLSLLALGTFGIPESRADDPDDGIGRAASLAAACSGCHAGPAEGIVSLEGRDAETIVASLLAYKAETGDSTVMHRLARGYSDEEVRAIAAYLGAEGKN